MEKVKCYKDKEEVNSRDLQNENLENGEQLNINKIIITL